ncbi:MAG TPA: alpha/beta hydrolase [Kofleriaceae bacterium]|jgi:arylformamidase|nr:alpha/beta hydrolase [Kofleriaceae bacterium]
MRDYETEYRARLRVPAFLDIMARWQADSVSARRTAHTVLDQPYGAAPRQRYDLLCAAPPAADRPAPLVVFIHGGYWQLDNCRDYQFTARALNAAGIDVAFPWYSLCPAVSVLQIVDELRRCVAALWTRRGQRPIVVGHSAGGHLTAALLATDWTAHPGAPGDLVRAGVAISGVFELAPLVTTTMNTALQLDPASAVAASPLGWPVPPPAGARTLVAAVGGDETDEFHRQSRAIVETWGGRGVHTEHLPVAGANHFTVVDALADPGSTLFRRVVDLTREPPAPLC